MSGGGEDGAVVAFQNLEPMVDIRGVLIPYLGGEVQVCAEKRGSKFGSQFLGGIARVTPALAPEIAVETGLMFCPVAVMPISA